MASYLASVFNWLGSSFASVLTATGLVSKKATIILVGLDNSGKTTLLHMMTHGTVKSFYPSNKPTMEQARMDGILLSAYDLGGMAQQRRIWQDYVPIVDGVVFVVDSSDPTRFAEASNELQKLLSIPELEDKPIVVLGNKIDMPTAVSERSLREALGITITTPNPPADWKASKIRPLELFMCSIVQRMGYGEGLKWLARFL